MNKAQTRKSMLINMDAAITEVLRDIASHDVPKAWDSMTRFWQEFARYDASTAVFKPDSRIELIRSWACDEMSRINYRFLCQKGLIKDT